MQEDRSTRRLRHPFPRPDFNACGALAGGGPRQISTGLLRPARLHISTGRGVAKMELTAFAFEVLDGVAHITMNQPERGNPLDERFARGIRHGSRPSARCAQDVRAVLIDAKGRFFSVGGDLNALTQSREDLARFVSGATSDLHMGISRFARMNAPVVVAVHGLAAGGAVALVAGADFVLAVAEREILRGLRRHRHHQRQRRQLFPAAPHGLAPRGAVLHAQRNAERRRGRRDGPHQPGRAPPTRLRDEAWALATQLAQGPTLRVRRSQESAARRVPTESLEGQLENEARAMARVTRTDDAWNAMRAVLAKQKPTFEGALARLSMTNRVTRFAMIFNEDQLAIRDLARRFAREKLAPHYQARDKIGVLDRVADPRDGRARPDGRRSAGGLSAGLARPGVTAGIIAEELAYGDFNVSAVPVGVSLLGAIIMSSGDAEACGLLDSAHDQRRDPDGRLRHRAQRRLRRGRDEAALPPRRRLTTFSTARRPRSPSPIAPTRSSSSPAQARRKAAPRASRR